MISRWKETLYPYMSRRFTVAVEGLHLLEEITWHAVHAMGMKRMLHVQQDKGHVFVIAKNANSQGNVHIGFQIKT